MKQIKKIKGVNLGGWLVLEKWIDEMPFKNTYAEDETWLARELNQNELKERLTKHRETFITEKDFKNFVIYKGQKFEADVAYIDIWSKHGKNSCSVFYIW